MMEQIILHTLGDYVLQNHAMANNKQRTAPDGSKRPWRVCLLAVSIHVSLYMLPWPVWLYLEGYTKPTSWALAGLLIMGLSHLVIDLFALQKPWVKFWGVGVKGWFVARLAEVFQGPLRAYCGVPPVTAGEDPSLQITQPPDAPVWLQVPLSIINDNFLHIVINYACLRFLIDPVI